MFAVSPCSHFSLCLWTCAKASLHPMHCRLSQGRGSQGRTPCSRPHQAGLLSSPPRCVALFHCLYHHLSIEMEGSHMCMQEERSRQGALSCCERGPAWCVHVRRPSSAHPRPLNAMSADTVQWVVQTLEKASPWRLRSCRAAQCKRFGPRLRVWLLVWLVLLCANSAECSLLH